MKIGEAVRVPDSNCTSCGRLMTGVSGVGVKRAPRKPSPGSFTVCIKCGHVMVFDQHLRLRDPNGNEAYAIAGDARLLAIQQARAAIAPIVEQRKQSLSDGEK